MLIPLDSKTLSPKLLDVLLKCIPQINSEYSTQIALHGNIINLQDRVKYTSDEYVIPLITNRKDIPVSTNKFLYHFNSLNNGRIITELMKIYPTHSIIPSGSFYYPPGGYMSWHTNSDVPVNHLYITYADCDDKSCFKYYDSAAGQIISDFDKQGFNVRYFETCNVNKGLFWHCVVSDCNRYSFGFRIINNL